MTCAAAFPNWWFGGNFEILEKVRESIVNSSFLNGLFTPRPSQQCNSCFGYYSGVALDLDPAVAESHGILFRVRRLGYYSGGASDLNPTSRLNGALQIKGLITALGLTLLSTWKVVLVVPKVDFGSIL